MSAAASRGTTRLRRKLEFDRVFDRPLRSSDGDFTVLSRANDCGHARLGLVVSKRVDKRAVRRNRLKRIIRESFRQGPIQAAPVDLVVIAKGPAAAAAPSRLRQSLDRHWQSLLARYRDARIG